MLNPTTQHAPLTGYHLVCYFSNRPSQDTADVLTNGRAIDLGIFATYSDAMAARNAFTQHPDYVGYFMGEQSQYEQEESNHA